MLNFFDLNSLIIWGFFATQFFISLYSFAYCWSFFQVSYLLLKIWFWWYRHIIWVNSWKRFLSFLLHFSFVLLSFLDNTPQNNLAQILFSFPIILSVSAADWLRILLTFMWFFSSFWAMLHITESYLWAWTCQVFSHPWSLFSHLYG